MRQRCNFKTQTSSASFEAIPSVIIPLIFFAFNVCLVLFPEEALDSAGEGLRLWFNRVLPSLLPFAIGVNILTKIGGTELLGKLLSPIMRILFNLPGTAGVAFFAGLTSGYPMGAKAAADLRAEALLTENEAQRLAGFCNNAGPLFIVGMAGTGLFGDSSAGYKILAAHVLSAVILGIALGFTAPRIKTQKKPREFIRGKINFGLILSDAVKNAMEAMAFVGGLIVFFNVLTRVLAIIGIASGLTSALLEVTSGVKNLAEADYLSYRLKLILAAGVISFGGLSVHAQALNFLSRAGVKAMPYLLCKIFHGLIAAGVMFFLTRQQ